jgi:hypothetical protein
MFKLYGTLFIEKGNSRFTRPCKTKSAVFKKKKTSAPSPANLLILKQTLPVGTGTALFLPILIIYSRPGTVTNKP